MTPPSEPLAAVENSPRCGKVALTCVLKPLMAGAVIWITYLQLGPRPSVRFLAPQQRSNEKDHYQRAADAEQREQPDFFAGCQH